MGGQRAFSSRPPKGLEQFFEDRNAVLANHGIVIDIEHGVHRAVDGSPLPGLCLIAGEDAVDNGGRAGVNVQATTIAAGDVVGEVHAADSYHTAPIEDTATVPTGLVLADQAVGDVGHMRIENTATVPTGLVLADHAVVAGKLAAIEDTATVPIGPVMADHAVSEERKERAVVDAATVLTCMVLADHAVVDAGVPHIEDTSAVHTGRVARDRRVGQVGCS